MKDNIMRKIEIEKVVLSVGALEPELTKGIKLLSVVSGKKAVRTRAKKRIPAFNIRPGLEIGGKVTLRDKEAEELLKRLFAAVNNKIKLKQINNEDMSFGVLEYIEIPGIEYQRDIGMMGFSVTITFCRRGKRIQSKKIKRGKLPMRQRTRKEEIAEYLKNKFNLEIEGKKAK